MLAFRLLARAPPAAARVRWASTSFFTKDHEYAKVAGKTVTCGITDFAQVALGDVVYVSLPSVGATVKKGCVAGGRQGWVDCWRERRWALNWGDVVMEDVCVRYQRRRCWASLSPFPLFHPLPSRLPSVAIAMSPVPPSHHARATVPPCPLPPTSCRRSHTRASRAPASLPLPGFFVVCWPGSPPLLSSRPRLPANVHPSPAFLSTPFSESMASVESVKAASDVYAPVSGKVIEANKALSDNPAMVNASAEGDAWFVKIEASDLGETKGMMDAEAYKKHCDAQKH